jgi:hypothetical protein
MTSFATADPADQLVDGGNCSIVAWVECLG